MYNLHYLAWKCNSFLVDQVEFSKESSMRSSSLPQWFCDGNPSPTYEGDNSVLLQLTARHILKFEPGTMPQPEPIVNSRCLKSMERAAVFVAEREIERLRNSLEQAMSSGTDLQTTWN
jgi:hypothetical protein